jgi:hypothetical protein
VARRLLTFTYISGMASSDRFLATAAVIAQTIDDELVFFHVERGAYLTLDRIGTRMYSLLIEHGRAVALDLILAEYEVEPETLERDLDELIHKLVDAGLIASQSE